MKLQIITARHKQAVYVLLVLLALGNVALMLVSRHLDAKLAAVHGKHDLKDGMRAPTIDGFDLEGKRILLTPGQAKRPTLVLLFSPRCQYCDINWSTWNSVIASAPAGVDVVPIDISSSITPDYLTRFGVQPRVVAKVNPRTYTEYGVRVTPTTLLIDEHGKVKGSWYGLLTPTDTSALVRSMAGML